MARTSEPKIPFRPQASSKGAELESGTEVAVSSWVASLECRETFGRHRSQTLLDHHIRCGS